jgi:hypothetical protein
MLAAARVVVMQRLANPKKPLLKYEGDSANVDSLFTPHHVSVPHFLARREKMNFNTRAKVISALVATALVLIVGAIFCFGMLGYNNTHEWQIYQSLSGNVTVIDTPGYYWKGFGTVWTYPRSTQYYYSASDEEGGERDQSIRVTFNDGGTAQISSFVKIQLSTTADHRLRLHQDYGGNLENIRAAIRSHLTNCIKTTGPMMSASENQASRKAEFNETVEEQLSKGLFEMRRTTIELDEVAEVKQVKDPVTGESKTVEVKARVQATEIVEKDNQPVVVQDSPLALYGINIIQFSVTDTDYDPKTKEQFAAKKEAYLAAERAKAQRQEEQQQRLMIVEKGLRQVAETEAAANLEKKKATVEADKLREVAEIDKARAVIAAKQKVEVAAQEKQESETRRQIAEIEAQTAALKKQATVSLAEALRDSIQATKRRLGARRQCLSQVPVGSPPIVVDSLAGKASANCQ